MSMKRIIQTVKDFFAGLFGNKDTVSKDAAPARWQSGGRRGAYISAAAVLLAVLVLVFCILGGVFNFKAKAGKMPYVVGMTKELAADTLEGLGAEISWLYEYSDEAAGTVIGQHPDAESSLSSGDRITLTISAGQSDDTEDEQENEYVPVPDLKGVTYSDAEHILTSLGLSAARTADIYSDDVPAGTVAIQDPLAGARVAPGTAVTLTMALGPIERTYIVTASAGEGGSIVPSGSAVVKEGEAVLFTITPDEGFTILDLLVDGESVGATDTYVLKSVSSDHALEVLFEAAEGEPEEKDPEESGENETAEPGDEETVPMSPSNIR